MNLFLVCLCLFYSCIISLGFVIAKFWCDMPGPWERYSFQGGPSARQEQSPQPAAFVCKALLPGGVSKKAFYLFISFVYKQMRGIGVFLVVKSHLLFSSWRAFEFSLNGLLYMLRVRFLCVQGQLFLQY